MIKLHLVNSNRFYGVWTTEEGLSDLKLTEERDSNFKITKIKSLVVSVDTFKNLQSQQDQSRPRHTLLESFCVPEPKSDYFQFNEGNTSVFVSEHPWTKQKKIQVTFKMDAIQWKVYRGMGHIGHLYNADLSNYLSKKGILNFYAVPSVNDSKRAFKGIKTITVTFLEGVK